MDFAVADFAHIVVTVTDVDVQAVGHLCGDTAAQYPGEIVFLVTVAAVVVRELVFEVGYADTGLQIGRKPGIRREVVIDVEHIGIVFKRAGAGGNDRIASFHRNDERFGIFALVTPDIFDFGAEVLITVTDGAGKHEQVVVDVQTVTRGVSVADVRFGNAAAQTEVNTVAFGHGVCGRDHPQNYCRCSGQHFFQHSKDSSR